MIDDKYQHFLLHTSKPEMTALIRSIKPPDNTIKGWEEMSAQSKELTGKDPYYYECLYDNNLWEYWGMGSDKCPGDRDVYVSISTDRAKLLIRLGLVYKRSSGLGGTAQAVQQAVQNGTKRMV